MGKGTKPVGEPTRQSIPSDANYGKGGKLFKPGTPRPFQPVFNFAGKHAFRTGIGKHGGGK